jgi:hypothetical protein
MGGRAARALRWTVAVAAAAAVIAPLLGCGDRAPPALWPEPPPPTLAAPIGIDEGAGEGELRPPGEPPTAPEGGEAPAPRSKLPRRDPAEVDAAAPASKRSAAAGTDRTK